MVNVVVIIVNWGFYVIFYLVRGYWGVGVDVFIFDWFIWCNYVGIDSVYFEIIVDGMEKVMVFGMVCMVYILDILVCGKIGMAENFYGEDYLVFFVFVFKKDLKIVIVVYVENFGFGGIYVVFIVSLMIEKYMIDFISDNCKWLEKCMLDVNFLLELF